MQDAFATRTLVLLCGCLSQQCAHASRIEKEGALNLRGFFFFGRQQRVPHKVIVLHYLVEGFKSTTPLPVNKDACKESG